MQRPRRWSARPGGCRGRAPGSQVAVPEPVRYSGTVIPRKSWIPGASARLWAER